MLKLENLRFNGVNEKTKEKNAMEAFFSFEDGTKVKFKVIDSELKTLLKELVSSESLYTIWYQLTPRNNILKKIEKRA